MTSTRSLVESSLLIGLAVVLFLAAHFLPIAGAFVSLLCPAPLVVLGLRHSLKMSLLGVGVATILAAALTGPVGAVTFCLGFGILGVGLGFLARRLKRGIDIILYGILISLGSKLLLMVVLTKITGINPFALDPQQLGGVVQRVFAFYERSGMSPEAVEGMKEQLETTIRFLPVLFPTLITIAGAVDCFLSYTVSGLVLKRAGGFVLPPLPHFSEWRFPKSIFWAFLVSLLLMFIGGEMGAGSISFRMGLNLRMLVSMLFLLQGLAVVWFYMAIKKFKSLFKILIVVFILFIPLVSQIVLMLGIADVWLDLRARARR